MQPGIYEAKVIAGRFIETEKGTMGVEIAFQLPDEKANWVGWLTPASIDNTMRTLVEVLGFNGDDRVDEKGLLPQGALDTNRKVSLTVENETYEGKTRARIKWVNDPNKPVGMKTIDPVVLKHQLNSVGFRQAYLATTAGQGKPIGARTPIAPDQVPF